MKSKKIIATIMFSIVAIFISVQSYAKNDSNKIPTSSINKNETSKDKLKVFEYKGNEYNIIDVDGGNLSGHREANVAVDIGYGDRVYWALTNEVGQLVYVIADTVVLQDEEREDILSNGRYYKDEAKVPGTEQSNYDEGHVIADSLGGVSNAYNITPQNSTLNRHGDQAYMEKVIRTAGGCENFFATITYPNKETQIPSKYRYEYKIDGRKIVDEFDNIDPDEANKDINKGTNENNLNNSNEQKEITKIDTNGNGKITIAEAKAAGYSMPITSEHWLYQYMLDADGDGIIGE